MNVNRDWHAEGLCNGHPDPDLWHYQNTRLPDEQQLEVLRSVQAIELCHECPVRAECLAQGMERENLISIGGCGSIWGGLMTSERALLAGGNTNAHTIRDERRHRAHIRQKIARISV
jgi:hypothetical protein